MEEQVVALYAVVNGFHDDIPTEDVPRFPDELREYLRSQGSVYGSIKDTKDITDETEATLRSEIDKFKNSFSPSAEAAA
jgi:F-type H+-transporting ATPase subunit alpha